MSISIGAAVSGSGLEALLRKYFIGHSSRKVNYLYWNATEPKDMTLSFVNLSGKELNRVNSSDLVYRIVRLKNADDWNVIVHFITSYIVDPSDLRAIYVIRVDYLVTYLKSIGYDVSKIALTRGAFGTVFCNNDDPTKRKPVSIVDTDVQSTYLIDRLYTKYRKMIYSDTGDWDVTDILEEYLTDPKFKYKVDDLKATLPVMDAVDIVARKFVRECIERDGYVDGVIGKDHHCKLEQIYLKNGMSTVMSRFTSSDIVIVAVRVYIQIFLRKYSKQIRLEKDKS